MSGGRGPVEIDVLSAEDLLVCKMLFDRPKDWVDVAAVVAGAREKLDADYVEDALGLFVESGDARLVRWRAALGAAPPPAGGDAPPGAADD